MVGLLIFIAASAAPLSTPPGAASAGASFRPVSTVSARATASVRLLAGAAFGRGQASAHSPGSQRRRVDLEGGAGSFQTLELLEFQ
jgi:hypothetical protein